MNANDVTRRFLRLPLHVLIVGGIVYACIVYTSHSTLTARAAALRAALIQPPLVSGFMPRLADARLRRVLSTGQPRSGSSTLIIAVSDSCPVCERAVPVLEQFIGRLDAVQRHTLHLQVIATDGGTQFGRTLLEAAARAGITATVDAVLEQPIYRVTTGLIAVPAVVLLNQRGEVRRSIFGLPSEKVLLNIAASLQAPRDE